MPKVSDEHRRAQAERFVDAARRCFTRLGVEGTSMEEIRTEAGVSAGLMYRYFASKDDMVRAAISGSMDQFEALVAHVRTSDDPATANDYLRSLLTLLQQFRHHSEGVDLFRLAVQGWAHAQSRPDLKTVLTDSFSRQVASYRSAAESWSTPAEADATAGAIAAAVIGYVVQSAFSDTDFDVEKYCSGLAAEGR
jgi:TetR/AcrR family transcriptional regulator, transcriptional repressor of aconitase